MTSRIRWAGRIAMLGAALATLAARGGWAQSAPARDNRLVFAQHNLNVTSFAEQNAFWGRMLGAATIKSPDPKVAILSFPNLIIFMRENPPKGGTTGSTVDHVAFRVPNLRDVVSRLGTQGYRIVTREEVPASQPVENGIAFSRDHNANVAFALAPDGIKVELIEAPSVKAPDFHHVHFVTPQPETMQAWYTKVFGSKPTKQGSIAAGALPLGVTVLFSSSPTAVASTRGRVIDHIGFEVRALKEFCDSTEAQGVKLDQPYRIVPAPWFSHSASLTDPMGTNIQVTEGAAFGFFRSFVE